MPFQKGNRLGAKKRLGKPTDKQPICFIGYKGQKEGIKLVSGWQDKLREFVAELIDAELMGDPQKYGLTDDPEESDLEDWQKDSVKYARLRDKRLRQALLLVKEAKDLEEKMKDLRLQKSPQLPPRSAQALRPLAQGVLNTAIECLGFIVPDTR